MRRQIHPDRVIAALAGAQGGRISREQMLRQGIAPSAIDRRVQRGHLHPKHRGVYAVGHILPTPESAWWSALLAYGDDAVLSHDTAAAAWRLRKSGGAVHITCPRTGVASVPGVRAHRSRRLPGHERTELRGMPITTPARTVLDLAPRLSDRRLEQLLDRGEDDRILDLRDLRRALAEHRGRAGTPRLRRVLEGYAPTVTRSELEEGFVELCDAHHIARPMLNTIVAGHEVDAFWPAASLVVELDGYAYHRSPDAFERDRARDVALTLAGLRVIRLTWRAVTRDGAATANAIRRLLASGPS
jgi:Protein of unknown function (DUF559)